MLDDGSCLVEVSEVVGVGESGFVVVVGLFVGDGVGLKVGLSSSVGVGLGAGGVEVQLAIVSSYTRWI